MVGINGNSTGALEKLPQIMEFREYSSALVDEGTMMFHLEEMA